MKLRVGVDLGGMSAKLGVVNENNEIVDRKVIPTEKGITFEETIAKLADGILSLGDVGMVGFGVPSSLMPGTDIVIYANNLGWKNKDIKSELAKHLGDIPVYIANDADSATVGEYFQGAGRGYQSVLMLTLGTGVGGGFIYNGHLYRGGNGCGFEPGHMTIRMDGVPCTCGKKGCLEAYCSAFNFTRDIGVTPEEFFDGLAAGNRRFEQIWEENLDYLSIGINNLRMAFDCNVILGGYVSQYLEPYLPLLREKAAARNTFEADASYIKLGKYPTKAGMRGVAWHFMEQFIQDI